MISTKGLNGGMGTCGYGLQRKQLVGKRKLYPTKLFFFHSFQLYLMGLSWKTNPILSE
jgi:hypothetical protein